MNILNSVEKYDPHTGHWTNVTPMATKRSGKTNVREGTVDTVLSHLSICSGLAIGQSKPEIYCKYE